MSRIVRRRWTSSFSGPTRKDTQGCEYEAYVPDTLAGRAFVFDAPVVNRVVEAEAAISRLNTQATSLVNTRSGPGLAPSCWSLSRRNNHIGQVAQA